MHVVFEFSIDTPFLSVLFIGVIVIVR